MIERPAAVKTEFVTADAGGNEAAEVVSTPQIAPSFTELAPAPPAHVLAGRGPDPSLAQPPPPKFADRTQAQFGPPATRATSMRIATRESARTEHMTYRAVFACCTEAPETPTEE